MSIGQLCSGTLLNPTLSVTAPPGLQFYNANPKPVPVVYGNAFVEGTVISDIYAEEHAVSYQPVPGSASEFNSYYFVALWEAICLGKIKLNWIISEAQVKLSPAGLPYDPERFNDGTGSYFPALWDKSQINGSAVPLPYLSPLHGIAHYNLSQIDGIPVDLTSKVPKIQYDVTRILNTGLSINGDDITYSGEPVVAAYLTYNCMFHGVIPGENLDVACPANFLKIDDRIVFHTPTVSSLPPEITAEVPYWIVSATNGGSGQIIKVSATQGGSYITPSFFRQTYSISLVLIRNSGNNPASVIWDLLTDNFYGLGLSAVLDGSNPDINVASFQNVLEFFYSSTVKPYGVNCSFQDKTPAKDMIKKVCDWTDCILTTDNDGKFYLTVNDPNRLTTQGRIGGITLSSNVNIDNNGVPLLVTDDFDDFKPLFKTYDDTINESHGKFISFADSYATLNAFYRQEANISITGTVRSKDFDLSCLIFPDTVSVRLLEIAKRESWPLITISTVCKIGLMTALVNDIWRITHAEYGIDDYFKITKKTFVGIEAGQVKIEWTQCPELMFDMYSTGMSSASASVPTVVIPGGSLVIQNVIFPAGTSLSVARTDAYTDDSKSTVVWGVGQENSGTLVYDPDADSPTNFPNDGDYYIVDHNKIQLNATKFANTIQANMLSLLNVNTY